MTPEDLQDITTLDLTTLARLTHEAEEDDFMLTAIQEEVARRGYRAYVLYAGEYRRLWSLYMEYRP